MTMRSSGTASQPLRRARSILATLLVPVAALAAVVSGPAVAHASARAAMPAAWTTPASIPSAITNGGSPALADFDGHIYATWQGQSSPFHIWYSAFNGTSWSASKAVPGATISEEIGPALEANGGVISVAWDPNNGPTGIDYSQNP
jgi:hypothetical protein